ncbi:hypothetical protein STEG23_024045 [Scotinomys teguina]
MWYIYTMEYYAAEKNNGIMKIAGKWMELENIILSKMDDVFWKERKRVWRSMEGFNVNCSGCDCMPHPLRNN